MRVRVAMVVLALVAGACGGPEQSAERLCEVQVEIAGIVLFTGDASPDEVRETIERVEVLADEMVDVAPDDARVAAEASRAAAQPIFDLLESVDYDESRITPTQVQGVATVAGEGSADLLAWVAANCDA